MMMKKKVEGMMNSCLVEDDTHVKESFNVVKERKKKLEERGNVSDNVSDLCMEWCYYSNMNPKPSGL